VDDYRISSQERVAGAQIGQKAGAELLKHHQAKEELKHQKKAE
jgi:hypothetical protein